MKNTSKSSHLCVLWIFSIIFSSVCLFENKSSFLLHRNGRSITSKLIQHAITTTTANRKMHEHNQKDKSQFQTELYSSFSFKMQFMAWQTHIECVVLYVNFVCRLWTLASNFIRVNLCVFFTKCNHHYRQRLRHCMYTNL